MLKKSNEIILIVYDSNNLTTELNQTQTVDNIITDSLKSNPFG